MNLLDLFVKISVDDKASAGVDKSTQNIMSKLNSAEGGITAWGGKVASGIGKAFAAVGVGMMIADVVKEAFTQGAEYEQLVGGVETLFKGSSDKVVEYAKNAYKTAGLSANEYMTSVTSFSASLLQSLGGDTDKAADTANMALTDMSDNANKMGTSMESIQYAYQGFAKQNYTMLDNLKLGYGGTQSEMKRLLEDASKLTGVHYDISNLSDVYDAIHAVQTELGITGTTATEAATTVSGSWGMLKASWTDFLTALSTPDADFSVVVKNMVDSAVAFLSNAVPMILTIVMNLILAIGSSLANWLAGLAGSFGTWVAGIVLAIADWFAGIGMRAKAFFDAIITAVADWFTSIGEGISKGIDDVIQWIIELPSRVVGFFADVGTWLFESGKKLIQGFVDGIWASLGNVEDAAGAVAEAGSGYFPHSPAKKGAFSGKGWTLYSGMATADAFAEGFRKQIGSVTATIQQGMTGFSGAIASPIKSNTSNTSITMNVTADSTTTLESLIAQANRARMAYR